MEFIDKAGNSVRLGAQVGRRGGEGCVFQVVSQPGVVAKIFHAPASSDKEAKLLHMANLANGPITSMSAWPKSPLWDSRRKLVGFTMPAVHGNEIHELYNPKQRSVQFPRVEWDFLIRVARNCSAAFDEIHNTGAVIGDVNEGHILVKADGKVCLIDCDSYQISANGTTWTCDVGVPLWTAPELQNKNFPGLHRTINNDLFPLAVLIFELLFMGRHPFAGIPLTSSELPIEKGIAEFRFAFTKDSQSLLVKPPPQCFPVLDFPQPIRGMFDRAFLRGSERLGARPSGREWATALDSLGSTLTRCGNDRSHVFPGSFSSCPWCTLAIKSGVSFFFSVVFTTQNSVQFNANIWLNIEAAKPLPPIAAKYSNFQPIRCAPFSLPQPITRRRIEYVIGVILFPLSLLAFTASHLLGTGILLFSLAFLVRGPFKTTFCPIRNVRAKSVNEARNNLEAEVRKLQTLERGYQQAFDLMKNDLRVKHHELNRVEDQRKTDLRNLENHKREILLDAHLDRFLITRAQISGIGPKRRQALLAYGIQSALDVPNCRKVPGIGELYYSKLMNWRRQCADSFRFDPAQSIPAAEIQKVELKFAQARRSLESEMQKGLAQLQFLNTRAAGDREPIELQVQMLIKDYSQAKTDLDATPQT